MKNTTQHSTVTDLLGGVLAAIVLSMGIVFGIRVVQTLLEWPLLLALTACLVIGVAILVVVAIIGTMALVRIASMLHQIGAALLLLDHEHADDAYETGDASQEEHA